MAEAFIGIRVRADAQQFQKEMRESAKHTADFGHRVREITHITRLFGLVHFARQFAEASDQIRESSIALQLGEISIQKFTEQTLRAIPAAGTLGGALADTVMGVHDLYAVIFGGPGSPKRQDFISKEIEKTTDQIEQLQHATERARQLVGLTGVAKEAKQIQLDFADARDRVIELGERLEALGGDIAPVKKLAAAMEDLRDVRLQMLSGKPGVGREIKDNILDVGAAIDAVGRAPVDAAKRASREARHIKELKELKERNLRENEIHVRRSRERQEQFLAKKKLFESGELSFDELRDAAERGYSRAVDYMTTRDTPTGPIGVGGNTEERKFFTDALDKLNDRPKYERRLQMLGTIRPGLRSNSQLEQIELLKKQLGVQEAIRREVSGGARAGP